MSKKSFFPFSEDVLNRIDSFTFDYKDLAFNFSGSFEVYLLERQINFYLDSSWHQLKDGNFRAMKIVRSRIVDVFPDFSDFRINIVFAL